MQKLVESRISRGEMERSTSPWSAASSRSSLAALGSAGFQLEIRQRPQSAVKRREASATYATKADMVGYVKTEALEETHEDRGKP